MEKKPQTPQQETFPPNLELHGDTFAFIQTRPGKKEAVYKGPNSFLKIGRQERIGAEMGYQRELGQAGAPVARILEEGELGDKYFYLEESMGEPLLVENFKAQTAAGGIEQPDFEKFVDLAQRFSKAQLATASKEDIFEKFIDERIELPQLLKEMPQLTEVILAAKEKMRTRTSVLSNVVTHADLHPVNMTARGIIDFASSRRGVAGYDPVTAIYDTNLFPKDASIPSETYRTYEYSTAQREEYLRAMDEVYLGAGLPALSEVKDEFILMRTIWGSVHRTYAPNLKKWRQELLTRLLDAYIHDRSVEEELLRFSA